MPKKFLENTKAAEGRQRKLERKEELKLKEDAKKEEQERMSWQVGAKDEGRKMEAEKKRLEKLQQKAERERLLAEEETALKSSMKASNPAAKVSTSGSSSCLPESRSDEHEEDVGPYGGPDSEEDMPSVGGATSPQSSPDPTELQSLDRHPERRLKASYAAFEEKEMAALKSTYPMLRRSQLQQMILKKWKKSPENPLNRPSLAYNAPKGDEKDADSG